MDRWEKLTKLAAGQHGAVSAAQAEAIGIPRRLLDRRVARHGWRRPLPGVYLLPGARPGPETMAMACLLALGRGAVVAGRSAAAFWGIAETHPERPHLLLPHADRRDLPGACIRRSRTLDPSDTVRLGPLRVTTVARTLCDLAGSCGEDALTEYVARAAQRDWRWLERTRVRAAQLPRLPGRTQLERALRRCAEQGRTDSPRERQARRILKGAGLHPHPGVYPIAVDGRVVAVVDIAFPGERVAVEIDGFAFHATPAQLRADHDRQNVLHGLGWLLLRFGGRMLQEQPDRVITQIRTAIQNRRGTLIGEDLGQ